VLLASLANVSPAQERDRSKVAEQCKWDLTAIYPTDPAWREQKDQGVAELPKRNK
jgi:oligoendopeptidase F